MIERSLGTTNSVEMKETALTTVFRSNGSQAVRLPKALELTESVNKVSVTAIGNFQITAPIGESWAIWFDRTGVTADFMDERNQLTNNEAEFVRVAGLRIENWALG